MGLRLRLMAVIEMGVPIRDIALEQFKWHLSESSDTELRHTQLTDLVGVSSCPVNFE